MKPVKEILEKIVSKPNKKTYTLQGRKDAIKHNLVAIYEFTKEYGSERMGSTDIDGKKTVEEGTLLKDGRVRVEIYDD